MNATQTRQHPDQTEVTVITVTLPNGKTQQFVRHSIKPRVYAGGTQYWSTEDFDCALDKMRAAGATVVESVGYVFEEAR